MQQICSRAADMSLKASETYPDEGKKYEKLAEMVEHVRAGRSEGLQEFYELVYKTRHHFAAKLPSHEVEDKVHETFLDAVYAIQSGNLREPCRIMGFVWTIVRRKIAFGINDLIDARRCEQLKVPEYWQFDQAPDQEQLSIRKQSAEIARKLIDELDSRDRELLTRFYLLEQRAGQICSEMGLTPTQFRLFKSRAKQKLAQQGEKQVRKKRLRTFAA